MDAHLTSVLSGCEGGRVQSLRALQVACAVKLEMDQGDVHVDLQGICCHVPKSSHDELACQPLCLLHLLGMFY